MRFVSLFIVGLSFFSQASHAGICEITVKRAACPGKEAESYKKCDGKEECTNKQKADSEAACQKLAENECVNSRLEITKSKEIKASFGGAAVKGGANLCATDRPDFNKCK